jgi:predicted RNase H-like HicB family nuclease
MGTVQPGGSGDPASAIARHSRSPAGAADTVRDLCWQCPDLGLGNMSPVFVNAEHGGCREGDRRYCRRLQAASWLSGHTGDAAYPDRSAVPGRDWFIAQCLEVDVASQGHTIDEALAGLAEASSCRHAGELARRLPHGSTHVPLRRGLLTSASITRGRRTLMV